MEVLRYGGVLLNLHNQSIAFSSFFGLNMSKTVGCSLLSLTPLARSSCKMILRLLQNAFSNEVLWHIHCCWTQLPDHHPLLIGVKGCLLSKTWREIGHVMMNSPGEITRYAKQVGFQSHRVLNVVYVSSTQSLCTCTNITCALYYFDPLFWWKLIIYNAHWQGYNMWWNLSKLSWKYLGKNKEKGAMHGLFMHAYKDL